MKLKMIMVLSLLSVYTFGAAITPFPSPFAGRCLDTAVWQYCAVLKDVPSRETGNPVRAFLWVPPAAQKIRGVMVGQYNMLERPILEAPEFRKHLEEIGWGCVWLDTGMFGGHFNHHVAADSAKMQKVFDALSACTGLVYFKTIPFIGIGHSAMADFGYELAAWQPDRAMGAISYDGNTLCVGKQNKLYDHPFVTPADLEKMKGVPLLHRDSEGNSGRHNRRTPQFRTRYPDVPFTILADPSSTHFGFPETTCDFLGAWVAAADKLRNPNGGLPLVRIDPASGWYVDFWRYDAPPLAPAAPVAKYTGTEGNWVFNEEIARLMQEHVTRFNNKKHCIAAFEQDGKIVFDHGGHVGFTLRFNPEADGQRFPLCGVFLKTVPEGRQAAWAGMKPGEPLIPPDDPEHIVIRRICGPVEILDHGYAAVRFDRYGFNRCGRANSISVILEYPGNREFRRSEIPAEVRIPLKNKDGAAQTIRFPALPDVSAATRELKLGASSSLGLPVEYFVDYGPAYLKDGVLYFTPLPQCTHGPIEVKVTAYQYGRVTEPKIQSAEPVSQTFHLLR